MQKIVTSWAYLNYPAAVPHDLTMLFSEDIDNGWEITTLSTALDTYREGRIIVVTALLTK